MCFSLAYRFIFFLEGSILYSIDFSIIRAIFLFTIYLADSSPMFLDSIVRFMHSIWIYK